MSVSDARIQELLDFEDIRRVKADYCHWSDRGYPGAGDNPAEVAALFAADGWWGDTNGRDAIVSLFERFQRELPFALHMAFNARITIAGDHAAGQWTGVIPATNSAGEALSIAGRYDDEFTCAGGVWLIARLRFTPAFHAPYAQGWARE
jgi:hypothetical protein